MRLVVIALILVSVLSLAGCTTTQKGMTIGALGGSVAGAAISYWGYEEDTDKAISGALIGAATGAVAGAIVGYFAGE